MPLTRKLLLKDERGIACAALTVTLGERPDLHLPQGANLVAALVDEGLTLCKSGESITIKRGASDLSVLTEYGGKRLFATTLTGEAATFAKWRLTESVRERSEEQKVPTTPLKDGFFERQDEEGSTDEQRTENGKEYRSCFDGVLPDAETEDPSEKARRLIEGGEPFPLFENLMPHSKWAKIENEECLCLVGIVEDDEGERVLYGVAGTPGFPPDEDKLWTYFPTGEEEGYYLTEYEQS